MTRRPEIECLCASLLAMFAGSFGRAEAPATTASAVRFAAVDVFVDSKATPLAAYQLEFLADAQRVKLVGIEGGEHPAFAQPPYYDPAALSHSRVILAALNASPAKKLPTNKTRVARLHLEITGPENAPLNYSAKLAVAASADEKSIAAADVTVVPSEGVAR